MDECCGGSSVESQFDLIVIGAGSAGFSAAIAATELGAQVLVIGEGLIGGTCVNIGCVPSKTMIRAAEAMHQARTASRFNGIAANAQLSDWRALQAQKQALVDELRQAKYIDVLPSYEAITYREGRAKLCDGGVVVGDKTFRAAKIIIATGSAPAVPEITGLQQRHCLSSQSALELPDCPRSMIIVGGGVIGCELGQMFARFGCKVSLLCRSRLLPSAEPEVSAALAEAFSAEGINVICGASYDTVQHHAAGDGAQEAQPRGAQSQSGSQSQSVTLTYRQGGKVREKTAQYLLVATGRRPNSDGLGLGQMGIATLPNGGIEVDDYMQTARPGVYAVGDVTGRDMFVYMAAYGARIAAEHALGALARRYDNSAMPDVTFTDPQVASVGLSEAQAQRRGIEVRCSVLSLSHVPRALAARDTRGLIKLVADAKTKRLLGAHIIAPEGADAVQTAAIAIKARMSVDELGAMIFPYLTTVEGLKLAAQTFDKDVSKLSCCA